MITDFTQRWTKRGRPRFLLKNNLFDPRGFEILPIDERTAKDYCIKFHYSKSYPAARRRFGLFDKNQLLRGVAVFSHPMSESVLSPFGGQARESVELGRLIIDDGEDVGFNCESYFVASCFRILRQEGFRGVISFADDFQRDDLEGKTVFAGHLGIIYGACGGIYTGRAGANTLYLLPDGRVFSRRAISKIRNGESGAEYAAARLESFGADPLPDSADSRRIWLQFWLEKLTRKLRHPGNHRYLFALQKSIKLPAGLPYPKIKYADLQPKLSFA
jgi:hypothetical protein